MPARHVRVDDSVIPWDLHFRGVTVVVGLLAAAGILLLVAFAMSWSCFRPCEDRGTSEQVGAATELA
jgi:hypothetical protein